MELMQLKMFRVVADERSIQRAAKRVLRTQPAVSLALKKLEQEVGVALFDRGQPRTYNLTAAGRLLYDYAVRLDQLEAATKAALQKIANERCCTRANAANASVAAGLNKNVMLYDGADWRFVALGFAVQP